MGVFVDDMLRHAAVPNGPRIVRGRWSHLMADTRDELRGFAGRLRLNPELIQKLGTMLGHYDITAAVREHALRLGAVRIAYGEGGHLTLCKRAGIPFDVDLLRRDRRRFQAQLNDAIRTGSPDLAPPSSRADLAARFG
jgi:hypothetical protein